MHLKTNNDHFARYLLTAWKKQLKASPMKSAAQSKDLPHPAERNPSEVERQILAAVKELSFGVVEIVIHDQRVTEIRQTRRTRLQETPNER